MNPSADPKKPATPAAEPSQEDEIDEAGEESFPASDPPAHSRPDVEDPPPPDLDPHLPD